MDPFSIIAGTTGTVAFALHTADKLCDFARSIRDAPAEITAIVRDCESLAENLETLRGWIDAGIIKHSAETLLSGPLGACTTTMTQIQSALEPYTRKTDKGEFRLRWRGFGWTFKRQEMRDLRDRLQHGKVTLSISINIITT